MARLCRTDRQKTHPTLKHTKRARRPENFSLVNQPRSLEKQPPLEPRRLALGSNKNSLTHVYCGRGGLFRLFSDVHTIQYFTFLYELKDFAGTSKEGSLKVVRSFFCFFFQCKHFSLSDSFYLAALSFEADRAACFTINFLMEN